VAGHGNKPPGSIKDGELFEIIYFNNMIGSVREIVTKSLKIVNEL
jgi:hypothetical protein